MNQVKIILFCSKIAEKAINYAVLFPCTLQSWIGAFNWVCLFVCFFFFFCPVMSDDIGSYKLHWSSNLCMQCHWNEHCFHCLAKFIVGLNENRKNVNQRKLFQNLQQSSAYPNQYYLFESPLSHYN